jgi:chemotaxis protein CheX
MDEKDIQVLISGTVNFFTTLVDTTAEVLAPYLVPEAGVPLLDYTGVIDISGARHGSIYFTAPSVLLRHILVKHGRTEITEKIMADVVGEVANTISGNARRAFGHEFLISVPRMIHGKEGANTLRLGERAFIVPIAWRQYQAALVVSLSEPLLDSARSAK